MINLVKARLEDDKKYKLEAELLGDAIELMTRTYTAPRAKKEKDAETVKKLKNELAEDLPPHSEQAEKPPRYSELFGPDGNVKAIR